MNDDLFFLNDELANVETNQSYEPIPAGNYKVAIVGAEDKANSKGTGRFIKLTLEVTEGRYQGRKLFENMNYRNNSPKAEEIGKRTMKTVLDLCGIKVIRSTDDFLGHVIPVQVIVKERDDKPGVFENNQRFSLPAGGEQPTQRPAAPSSVAQANVAAIASAPAADKPWARRSA